jgi:hypothetical protein
MGGIGDFSRGYGWNVVVGGGGLVSLAHAAAESLIFFDSFWRTSQATDGWLNAF